LCWFEWFVCVGFVVCGVIYGIIGVFVFEVVFGIGGKMMN